MSAAGGAVRGPASGHGGRLDPVEASGRFALGVLVAVVAPVAGEFLAAALRIAPLFLALPLAGFALGGAIAGHGLGVGPRGAAGFAIGFVVALPIAIFSLITLQGLGGRESFEGLVTFFGPIGAFAFGVMGVLGTGLAGLRRDILAAGVVFGGAGVLGGLLLSASQSVGTSPSTTSTIAFWLGILGYVALPPILGGIFLARRLANPVDPGDREETEPPGDH